MLGSSSPSNIDPRQRRKFARYKVSDLSSLAAIIDKGRDQEKIITLGQGGCGFYGFDPRWPFNPKKRIYCQLAFEDTAANFLTVESQIVYIKHVSNLGKPVVFYGVEFLPFERPRIKDLIDRLERLRAEGRVDLA
jgi:hypothetical protein